MFLVNNLEIKNRRKNIKWLLVIFTLRIGPPNLMLKKAGCAFKVLMSKFQFEFDIPQLRKLCHESHTGVHVFATLKPNFQLQLG